MDREHRLFGPEVGAGDRSVDGISGGATEPDDATEADQPTGAQRRDLDATAVTPSPAPAASRRGSAGSFLRELPVLLVVALVLAFVLRTFVVQVFYIPSSSMEPTLSINDRMIVEKLTYRVRDPLRGEIVVFEGGPAATPDSDDTAGTRLVRGVGQFLGIVPASARDFVKRVIGLPGDEIHIVEGEVRVNGVLLDEPYVVFGDGSDYGPVTVPEGSLFFLGDNRPNSSDSRRGLGFVPLDKVVGRSYAIIWPFDNATRLTGFRHELPSDAASP